MKKMNTVTGTQCIFGLCSRQALLFGCAILLLTGLTACSGNDYNSGDSSQGTAAESTASGTESEENNQDEVYEYQVEVDEDSTDSVEFGYSFTDDAD